MLQMMLQDDSAGGTLGVDHDVTQLAPAQPWLDLLPLLLTYGGMLPPCHAMMV
jgi:hypothetical protein